MGKLVIFYFLKSCLSKSHLQLSDQQFKGHQHVAFVSE